MNRRPKIYYATQVGTAPPTVVLFTNGPDLIEEPYQRYLLKTFRDQLPFGEVPIRLFLRSKQSEDGNGSSPDAPSGDVDTEVESTAEVVATAPTPRRHSRGRMPEFRHLPVSEGADADPAVWDV
jgi:GTP-binding protein